MFDYNLPKRTELQSLYITPYRFSKELRDFVLYMFQHPTKNKHRDVFISNHSIYDLNTMLKTAYLKIRYFKDNQQQYGHSLENITADILVGMWKSFLFTNKHFRGMKTEQYMKVDMKMMSLINGRFLDIFLKDIENSNYTFAEDVDRTRKPMGYSREQLDFYDTLE